MGKGEGKIGYLVDEGRNLSLFILISDTSIYSEHEIGLGGILFVFFRIKSFLFSKIRTPEFFLFIDSFSYYFCYFTRDYEICYDFLETIILFYSICSDIGSIYLNYSSFSWKCSGSREDPYEKI